ncbi:MAG: hypothetical protein LBI69_02270 [Puniceicoccales bacterium]|jgi:hypothetical protein|nr:hypothetical protein [Puniceicoccales bacterium]
MSTIPATADHPPVDTSANGQPNNQQQTPLAAVMTSNPLPKANSSPTQILANAFLESMKNTNVTLNEVEINVANGIIRAVNANDIDGAAKILKNAHFKEAAHIIRRQLAQTDHAALAPILKRMIELGYKTQLAKILLFFQERYYCNAADVLLANGLDTHAPEICNRIATIETIRDIFSCIGKFLERISPLIGLMLAVLFSFLSVYYIPLFFLFLFLAVISFPISICVFENS